MSLASWLGCRFHQPRRASKPRRRTCPKVEVLEDRLAPATFNVTTTQDSATASLSLRAAILAADQAGGSNTINLPAGTYDLTLTGTSHDGTTGALQIRGNSLTINGQGTVVIDGSHLSDRVFDIESGVGSVTFNGIVIQNGAASGNSNGKASGGGIYDAAGADLTLDNTFLLDNTAANNGGGLYQNGGSLTISGGSVTGNSSTQGHAGGGIWFSGGSAAFGQMRVSANGGSQTDTGGGLWLSGSSLKMTDDFITSNAAAQEGGGMYASFQNALIQACTFSDNNGGTSFGGLYLQTSANSTFDDNFVTNNQATSFGSGIYWVVNGGKYNVINDVIISGNSGPNGAPGGSGASFHLTGSTALLYIQDSTISGNATAGYGGGIFATTTSGSNLVLINDTVYGNRAQNGGGGLYATGIADSNGTITSSGTVSLLSDTISGNTAATAGGVYNAAGTMIVDNTLIAQNSASSAAPDVAGTFQDGGYNLIGVSDGSSGFTKSTLVGTGSKPINAALGALQDNGSAPTAGDPITIRPFTLNLLPTSPAIGAGDPGAPSTDERGFSRPGQGLSQPCIGAFEFQVPNGGDLVSDAYIENIYETLLTRDAEPAGLQAWSGLLNNGDSAAYVDQAILTNPEPIQDMVTGLYEKYLRRQPDAAGLQGWTAALQNGATNEQVILGFLTSPEYIALNGGTNLTYVTALYQDALGRVPDAAGLFGWVNQLDSGGLTKTQVAWGFLTSNEFRTNLVDSYYLQYLGRPADSGAAAWVNQLNAGLTDQAVLAAILGSSEAVTKRT